MCGAAAPTPLNAADLDSLLAALASEAQREVDLVLAGPVGHGMPHAVQELLRVDSTYLRCTNAS